MPRGRIAKQQRKNMKQVQHALNDAIKAARDQVHGFDKLKEIADAQPFQVVDTPLMWLPVFEALVLYGETGQNNGIEEKIKTANEAATELLDRFHDNEEMQLESIAKYDTDGCKELEFDNGTSMKMKNEQAYLQVCNDMKGHFMDAHELFRAIRYFNVLLRREGSITYEKELKEDAPDTTDEAAPDAGDHEDVRSMQCDDESSVIC
jgi:hypothetical protein